MTPGEEFYPALKKLSELPEWKVFEEFMDWKIKGIFHAFLDTGHAPYDLSRMQMQASELFALRKQIKDLIAEVEESHKLNRR